MGLGVEDHPSLPQMVLGEASRFFPGILFSGNPFFGNHQKTQGKRWLKRMGSQALE